MIIIIPLSNRKCPVIVPIMEVGIIDMVSEITCLLEPPMWNEKIWLIIIIGLIAHWGELVTGNSPMSGKATNGWIKIPNESRVVYSQGKIIPHEWLSRSGGIFFFTFSAKPFLGDNFAMWICHSWLVGNFNSPIRGFAIHGWIFCHQFFWVCQ